MKTILVDDEILSLEHFEMECRDISKVEVTAKFDFPLDALEYAKSNPVDCAVLDINMPEMDGLTLGRKLQELHPNIILIYVTGYGEYAQEAMAMRAAAYLMKPYGKDDILFAMHRAKLLLKGSQSPFAIKTFGRFDVFQEGRPIVFKNAKAKELLALCVEHRGGIVTMEEAVDKLWEGRPFNDQTKALYRKAVMSLRNELEAAGATNLFIKNRGSCYVNTDRVTCDYFELMLGSREAGEAYMGEFMVQYPWAEYTTARLARMVKRR